MALSGVPLPLQDAHARRKVGQKAREAAQNPWIEGLARFGLVVRGVIYFIPGALALSLALGQRGRATTQAGTIDLISRQPFGRFLLIAVAVGLAGYAIWGIIRAVFDPQHRGKSPLGLAQRFGYAFSAVAYAGLFVATLRYLTGSSSHVAADQDWTAGFLAQPFGALFVGLVGLCWIFGSGLQQIVQGWRAHFERDLALERMSARERRWATRLGRVGMIARGIVFTIIGLLLVAAALHRNPRGEGGLDGALLELTHHTFGRTMLGSAGVGLMVFGVYSAMCARWMRMRRRGEAPDATPSHPSLT